VVSFVSKQLTPLQQSIQSTYINFLGHNQFKPRHAQKLMIATLANSVSQALSDKAKSINVIEGPTGTGKTISYLTTLLPIAKYYNKQLLICTSTIHLQNQLIYQDLPEIAKYLEANVTFASFKGRKNYVCNARLESLQSKSATTVDAQIFPDEMSIKPKQLKILQTMHRDLTAGQWDGERDSLQHDLGHKLWNECTINASQCSQKKCSHYQDCIYLNKRKSLNHLTCIVTNQDVLLSDLKLGSGSLLPPLNKLIVVIDEAHQFHDKFRNHFSGYLGASTAIVSIEKTLRTLHDLQKNPQLKLSEILVKRCENNCEQLETSLINISELLKNQLTIDAFLRFDNNEIPTFLVEALQALTEVYSQLQSDIETSLELLKDKDNDIHQQYFQYHTKVLSNIQETLAQHQTLIQHYQPNNKECARWVTIDFLYKRIELHAAPLQIGNLASKVLWQQSAPIVLTSATIRTLGNFDHFEEQLQLPKHADFLPLKSHFNYEKQAKLQLYQSDFDPTNQEQHLTSLLHFIKKQMNINGANLVLFTQEKLMDQVFDQLNNQWQAVILKQNCMSRSGLINKHKQQIDAGVGSTIFGMQSFSEGIDLPGQYCTHVVITRIPFAVPNDPIEESYMQWLSENNINAFMQHSLPQASLKLIQASGRLLRNEQDKGIITICDQRILTKRYGQLLIQHLPSFAIERLTGLAK